MAHSKPCEQHFSQELRCSPATPGFWVGTCYRPGDRDGRPYSIVVPAMPGFWVGTCYRPGDRDGRPYMCIVWGGEPGNKGDRKGRPYTWLTL